MIEPRLPARDAETHRLISTPESRPVHPLRTALELMKAARVKLRHSHDDPACDAGPEVDSHEIIHRSLVQHSARRSLHVLRTEGSQLVGQHARQSWRGHGENAELL